MPQIAIRHRLSAVVFCSLLPMALLGYLFFAQSDKEIAFSAKEAQGTTYIQAIMPELVALAQQGSASQPLPDNAALTEAMAAFDGRVLDTTSSQPTRSAIVSISASIAARPRPLP